MRPTSSRCALALLATALTTAAFPTPPGPAAPATTVTHSSRTEHTTLTFKENGGSARGPCQGVRVQQR